MIISYSLNIDTLEEWNQGDAIALIRKAPGLLELPEELSVCYGPAEIGGEEFTRLWAIYRGEDGAIRLARSNEDHTAWESDEQVSFVPSGSTNPTIAFDANGYYVLAMEYLPAGATQQEIWMIDYPYDHNNVNKTADGQHPVLASDIDGVVYLFYQAVDTQVIEYRKDDDHYATVYTLPYSSVVDIQPMGFRTHHTVVSPYHDKYIYMLFFSDGTLRYYRSDDVDRYTVGVDMRVVNTSGQPLANATVVFNGETKTTDGNGEVTFMKVPWGVTLHYTINGNPRQTLIPEANKGTHIGLILVQGGFVEEIQPQPALTAIGWIETQFAVEEIEETIQPAPGLAGIEWEMAGVNVTFHVADSAGSPIEGATVDFFEQSKLTGANGQVAFTNVTATTHSYTVSKDGTTRSGSVAVGATDVFVAVNLGGYIEEIQAQPALSGISWQEIFYVTQEHEEEMKPAPALSAILWVDQS